MESNMTQVSMTHTPQVQHQKRSYVLPAAIAGGVGISAGYLTHREGLSKIAKVAAECDEQLIRNDLLRFWKWENGVPESSKKFFEDAVKKSFDFAKRKLQSTKNFYKGAALQCGLCAAAVTGLLIGLSSLLFGKGVNKND